MIGEDVAKKKGIYEHILSKDEKHLSIRSFSRATKEGVCIKCKKEFDLKDMEADHVTPWSKGGRTIPENCQVLYKTCNRKKSNK